MEHHYVHVILEYLQSNPKMGFLFTFLVAFSESLPLIGTVIPGSITMTLIGILVGMGAMSVPLTLTVASIAAFCGDCIGFMVGYQYNDKIRHVWPFKSRPHWLTAGEKFVAKHGGKSIIFGRFIGPARSTVPLVAGLLKMSWLRFIMAAIPSAYLWAALYTVPGIMIGALSRDIPKGETTHFFIYGLGTLAVIWFSFWLIQHFFIQLARFVNHMIDRCWYYLSRKSSGKIFIRGITNQQNPKDHHQLTLFFSTIFSGILFLTLYWKIKYVGALKEINVPIFNLLQSIRTPFWDKIFSIITIMGTPKLIVIISALLAVLLFIQKQLRTSAHILAAGILSAGATVIFKTYSHSLRPQGFEIVSKTSSFPSGHTALSFVLFSLLAFFATQILKKKHRWIPWTIACIAILLVAFSRLYLGAHWVSDILGSFLLGLSIATACIISYRRMPQAKGKLHLKHRTVFIVLLIGLGIPWLISIPLNLNKTLNQYTPVWNQKTITIENWWENPFLYTPRYRNDRFGKPAQPFNVQWQGSLHAITQTLKANGWKSPTTQKKLQVALQRFASKEAQYHLPVLSKLYHDKPPVLYFIKRLPLKNQVIELRLWESGIYLQPHNQPLWLGATNILIPPKKLFSLKEQTRISLKDNGGLNTLYATTSHFERKLMTISITQQANSIQKLEWNGKILLLRETVISDGGQ